MLSVDSQSGGIVKEVSEVYQKVESNQEIEVDLIRNGSERTILFSVGS